MSRVIGLTGGMACGKSEAGKLFAELGVPVVDTDDISRALTQAHGKAIPDLVAAFGADSLDQHGALDRKKMRERAFSDPQTKTTLEAILHPMIYQCATRELGRHIHDPYSILIVPLLIETENFRQLVDRILVVDCLVTQQVSRAMTRSQLDEPLIQRILAQQASREQRLAMADDRIDNQGDLAGLRAQVLALHQHYLGASQP